MLTKEQVYNLIEAKHDAETARVATERVYQRFNRYADIEIGDVTNSYISVVAYKTEGCTPEYVSLRIVGQIDGADANKPRALQRHRPQCKADNFICD